MAIAALVLLRSENKKAPQTPPADEPQVIPPVELTVVSPPEERTVEEVPSISSAEAIPASPPAEVLKHDLLSIPPVELTVVSPPEEGPVEEVPSISSAEAGFASLPTEVPKPDLLSVPLDEIVYAPREERRRRERPVEPGAIWLLLGLAAIVGIVLFLPFFFFVVPPLLMIVPLVIALVAVIRHAEPISGGNLLHAGMGFLGWFVIHTLYWVWALAARGVGPLGLMGEAAIMILGGRLLVVHVPLLIYLSLWNRWITLGVYLAILVNAVGMLLFVGIEEIGSSIVLPFFMHFFYPGR
jgi:hypothetical protein